MVFVLVLVLVGSIGYLAQTTGLCMVKGVDEASSGKPSFLLAVLFSGALGWVSLLAVYFFDLNNPFISAGINAWAMLGGLCFGVGAALNNGCGISTISKLARGQIIMAFTMIGWLVGWWSIEPFSFEPAPSTYSLSIELHISILVAITIVAAIVAYRFRREERQVWIAMLAIGLIAGVAFLLEPKWTPSALLRDLSLSRLDPYSLYWPSLERLLIFSGLLSGMILAAVITRSFAFESAKFTRMVRHWGAGILMGIGAAVAGGGNDSQLLLSLPALSLAGLLTIVSILLGIYVVKLAQSLRQRRN